MPITRRSAQDNRARTLFALLAIALLVAACAPAASAPAARVYFQEPAQGTTVSNPVRVRMAVDNFTVEPAGEVKAGAGHLHIIIDADCVPSGHVIPKDDHHVHYGQGQMEAELALPPGAHTLCLQAADGAHIALPAAGMTHKVSIVVR